VKKPFLLILIALLAVGGWYVNEKFELSGLDQIELHPREQPPAAADDNTPRPAADFRPSVNPNDTIRIASFNIQVFGTTKANKAHVMEYLARIIREFDVVAIQEIRSKDQDIVPRLVELTNTTDRHYDYVIGPRLGRTSSKEQYAFIFDASALEVDRNQIYTIDDRDDLMHREPLVAWFRVRGPSPEEAFTFTLVNIHTDPDETDQELDALDDVFRVVRDDGRGEDDVIILGDLNVDEHHLGELGQVPNITWAISGKPTNTRKNHAYDNLVFDRLSLAEFTGRSDVYDFMRLFNLTQEAALEISDHLPVWAEFSIYEGGQPGRIAARPDDSPVR